MQMADRIAEDGFQKAGYEYVCIDVSGKLDTFAITVEPCIMATLLLQPLYLTQTIAQSVIFPFEEPL